MEPEKAMTDKPKDAPNLGELRKDIDRIDEAMHRLLMERGEIINRLISVKKTQESGSAFRPAREADMMRRLVQRHRGILPLDTAESIWRVIISTFTHVQAPFSVHADLSAGDAMMRDSARFHFGFTVPFVPHVGAAGVVEAVSESKGDLGLVPAFATSHSGAWWSALEFSSAPKIIARLPFLDRPDHPAPLNVFVVSRAAADRNRDVEHAGRGLERQGRPRGGRIGRDRRSAGQRLRRRGAADFGAGRRRSDGDQGRDR
jgi:chorismate mutase